MNLLLDTCAFLWLIQGSPRLSARAAQLIADPGNRRWLSAVSVWEISVAFSRGRLPLPTPPDQSVPAGCLAHAIEPLPFEADAAVLEPTLPRHHRDPSDRMLVCQARARGLTILTPDPLIRLYPVATDW